MRVLKTFGGAYYLNLQYPDFEGVSASAYIVYVSVNETTGVKIGDCE
jgi:hypothetical protein